MTNGIKGRTSDGNVDRWLLFTQEDREQCCVSIKYVVRKVTHIWAVIEISSTIRSSLILHQILPYQNWFCSFFVVQGLLDVLDFQCSFHYIGIDCIKKASYTEKFNLLAIYSKDVFHRKQKVSPHWKD